MTSISDYNINEGFYEFWPWDESIHGELTEAILSVTGGVMYDASKDEIMLKVSCTRPEVEGEENWTDPIETKLIDINTPNYAGKVKLSWLEMHEMEAYYKVFVDEQIMNIVFEAIESANAYL